MSQEKKILEHLKSGKTLTPLEALDLYGTLRLGGHIHNLRKQGHNIRSERVRVGRRANVARYSMEGAA